MSCAAAEETRMHTSTLLYIFWEPVDLKSRPTAHGANGVPGANIPRSNTFHLGSCCSLTARNMENCVYGVITVVGHESLALAIKTKSDH